ncbi:Butyrophilin subfamily 1 member A1 [Camelus dromedarius]|uniref:Butyrophilin subfamily 1 member A1 n=1 Tax=Camelus dromedarius TaxID=9838 RepID=A0A5N4CRA7_CAMDR|nr:Butyrophilin subfamily 1 member A1 [Camelus dromedarius]
MSVSTEEFLVFSPSDPIVAVLGRDVTLRCRVFPTMSVEDMEPMWFRSKFSEAVFIYQNRQEQNEEQVAQYVGRTSLARRDLLTQGEAAVRIHNVQVSYNGLYTCSFRKGSLYKEATFELKVAGCCEEAGWKQPGGPPGLYIVPPAGVGSAPAVRITGPEEDGFRVVCTASGWFPKPQVQWRDLRGGKFLAFSEAHAQDAEGLFSVEATLVVRDSSVGNVTCSLLNPVLGQEKAMAIFIPGQRCSQLPAGREEGRAFLSVPGWAAPGCGPDGVCGWAAAPFFPQASPWKLAFRVSLTVLMILLLGAGCYTRREHATKLQEVAKKKRLCLDKEQDQREQEEARKEIGELQAQLAWRKSVYLAAWRKAQLYAGPVTLDPGSAHSDLVISHEKKSVAWKDCNNPSSDICSVLSFEGITAGRWYWEVEVRNGDRSEWALGVCREGVNRKGWYVESPDRGFWVLGRFGSGYCARTNPKTELSCRQVPHKVGVFLDHEEGDVSFYNMTDGSHIFSFPQASFSGALFPYFMLMSGDVSMTVCSTAGGSEGLPVPLNSSSLEEPVNLPEEGFCSGCGADALPGAQSPLLPCNPGAATP